MGISRICRFSPQLSFLSNLRSVWIELILLKLKIENWKYCSKIIFKYVIVPWDPFLMKKLLKSDICGFVNSARMHYSRLKSQHTVAANLLKCMHAKKKKKKKGLKTQTWVWKCRSKPTLRRGLDPRSRLTSAFPNPHLHFQTFFFSQRVNCNITWIYCARDKKYYSRTVHTMFKGSTVLFTHLKIILLQCFQFSVSAKISYIQTDL